MSWVGLTWCALQSSEIFAATHNHLATISTTTTTTPNLQTMTQGPCWRTNVFHRANIYFSYSSKNATNKKNLDSMENTTKPSSYTKIWPHTPLKLQTNHNCQHKHTNSIPTPYIYLLASYGENNQLLHFSQLGFRP